MLNRVSREGGSAKITRVRAVCVPWLCGESLITPAAASRWSQELAYNDAACMTALWTLNSIISSWKVTGL